MGIITRSLFGIDLKEASHLYPAPLLAVKAILPPRAKIQKDAGFRVKPGMTNHTRLVWSRIGRETNLQATCALTCDGLPHFPPQAIDSLCNEKQGLKEKNAR